MHLTGSLMVCCLAPDGHMYDGDSAIYLMEQTLKVTPMGPSNALKCYLRNEYALSGIVFVPKALIKEGKEQ